MPPIQSLTVLFVALSASAGTGYYYGWHGENEKVVKLELQLDNINAQAQKLLAETKARNAELTANQLIANAELEKKYHESIETNDNLHTQLVDAMRVRRSASAAGGCNSMPKAGDTARGQKDNAGGRSDREMDTTGFSENFDTVVSGKALQADKIDADRRLLLDWIKTIPPEMIRQ